MRETTIASHGLNGFIVRKMSVRAGDVTKHVKNSPKHFAKYKTIATMDCHSCFTHFHMLTSKIEGELTSQFQYPRPLHLPVSHSPQGHFEVVWSSFAFDYPNSFYTHFPRPPPGEYALCHARFDTSMTTIGVDFRPFHSKRTLSMQKWPTTSPKWQFLLYINLQRPKTALNQCYSCV